MLQAVRRIRENLGQWREGLSPQKALAYGLAVAAAYSVLLGVVHVFPRYDAVVFPVAAAAIVWLLGDAKAKPRHVLAACLASSTMFAFAVLAHLWTTGHEGRSAVLFGIVPYSDAGAFYADAERMLYGLRFGESSRRPLYVAVAGAILRWSGDDLRVLLGLHALAYGLAMGFMTYESWRVHGRVGGAIVLTISFFWVRRFTGFVATEALAFPLGALGFGLLLRVATLARTKEKEAAAALAAALAAVTFGLIARPGSLLVVPALVVWSRWAFAGRWRNLAPLAAIAGIAVAVLGTRAVTARLSSGATFGDYPGIAYALLHQGELHQAQMDHPELADVDPALHGKAILGILANDVRHDPTLLVIGPGDAFVSFLGGAHGLFSFVWTNPDDHALENGPLVRRIIANHGYLGPVQHWVHELGAWSFFNAIVMGALGGAFVLAMLAALYRLGRSALAVRRRRKADPSSTETVPPVVFLHLFVMAGILGSSIFAPTWIGEGMQMQSAIFGFVPLALALGLFPKRPQADPAEAPIEAPLRGLTGLTAATGVVLALAIVLACALPLTADKSGCGDGVISARLLPSTRTVIRPVTEATPNERSLETNLEFLARHNKALVASVRALAKVGDVNEVVYDACIERTRIVFGSPEVLPPTHDWTRLRFAPRDEPNVGEVTAP